MSDPLSPLRLNIGFIVAQSAGFSRDFSIELPQVHLPPDLDLTDLAGTTRITRTPQGLLLQVDMRGSLTIECVRCLDPFLFTLHSNFTELYAFSPRFMTDSGLLVPDDGQIDLTPVLRDYMYVELPLNPLCQPDCKGLCPVCGENQNVNPCNHHDDVADERLAVIKKLLDE